MPAPLLALRSAPPAFGIAEAERIARDLYGMDASALPLSGERDCNFHLHAADSRDFVLKIIDGAADPQTTDCQVAVLRHLASRDPSLPVPRLQPTRTGADLGRVERRGDVHAVCLTGYLPGRLLSDQSPSRPLLENVGWMLGRVDLALRGFFHPALGQRIAWDVRRLPELAQHLGLIEAAEIRRAVERTAAALAGRRAALDGLRAQAVHGDCHAANLLVDGHAREVCGVLDFGDMIHAPMILEAAVAMSEMLTEGLATIELLDAVLEGFARQLWLESDEVDALYDLICGRHAVTLVLHAWRVRHDPEGARIVAQAAVNAADSLDRLQTMGGAALTARWQRAAGTSVEAAPVDLARRHRLLGAGAELFYEAPLHIVRGGGVWLQDAAGRRYLDGYNNVPHVGHAHPAVARAIARQTAVLNTHTRYLHGSIVQYADDLTARCPAHLDACIFVNSGSEANDVAWRMAQFATGHGGGIVMAHAYHGITDAVARLTPGSGQPQDPRVVTLRPPPSHLGASDGMDPATLTAAAADADLAVRTLAGRGFAPAAFFIDSALTSSGIFDPPPAWAATVVSRLRAAGALIVADEVQYGLGRSGSNFWGFERRGMGVDGTAVPDIVTLGKPVGNGYPMGVVIARRALIEAFQARFGFFSTFGGNPVAAAAGLAVLQVIDRENLVDNAAATGTHLRRRLDEVAATRRCLGAVRGAGLLLGVEVLGVDATEAQTRTRHFVNVLAARHAVLIGSEGPGANVLKVRPPMPFGPAHADVLAAAIDAVAAEIDGPQPTKRSSSGMI